MAGRAVVRIDFKNTFEVNGSVCIILMRCKDIAEFKKHFNRIGNIFDKFYETGSAKIGMILFPVYFAENNVSCGEVWLYLKAVFDIRRGLLQFSLLMENRTQIEKNSRILRIEFERSQVTVPGLVELAEFKVDMAKIGKDHWRVRLQFRGRFEVHQSKLKHAGFGKQRAQHICGINMHRVPFYDALVEHPGSLPVPSHMLAVCLFEIHIAHDPRS